MDIYETADTISFPSIGAEYITDNGLRNAITEYANNMTKYIARDDMEDMNVVNNLYREISKYYLSLNLEEPTDKDFEKYPESETDVLSDYVELQKKNSDEISLPKLQQRIINETNYDRRVLLLCQYIRLYSPVDDATENNAAFVINELENMQYSYYLNKLWRFFRAWRQTPSRFSTIPNLSYNFMRKQVALIYLRKLAMQPQDKLTLCLFSYLYQYEDISRFAYANDGSIIPGNSILIEEYNLDWYGLEE